MSDFFRQGVEAFECGKLDEALAAFSRCDTNDARVHTLQGSIYARQGKLEDAEKAFRTAIDLEPGEELFLVNYALFLSGNGRENETEEVASKASVIAQRSGVQDRILGVAEAFFRSKLWKSAAQSYEAARHISPLTPPHGKRAAFALSQAGDVKTALEILDILVSANAADREVFELGTTLLALENNWERLEQVARVWASVEPGQVKPSHLLSQSLFELGRYDEAVASFEAIAERFSDDAKVSTTFGGYCLAAQQLGKAKKAFENALSKEPGNIDALCGLARLTTYDGDIAAAAKYCRSVIELQPDCVQAYSILTALEGVELTAAERSSLARLSSSGQLPVQDQISASYAYGDACSGSSGGEKAFAAYQKANAIQQKYAESTGDGYNHKAEESQFRHIKTIFTKSMTFRGQRKRSHRPIFVVGMPRSGTTLLESIMAAHSNVIGCGEMQQMPSLLANVVHDVQQGVGVEKSLSEHVRYTLSSLDKNVRPEQGESYFVDKQPMNFKSVGLMNAVFPDAAIVHIRRNPLDTCYSIYRRNFSKYWPFSTCLENLGRFYALYARYMAYWSAVYPGKVLEIQYEDLVENFDATARAVIDHCGLDWQAACAAPESVERSVATFSAVQVRRPVSRRPSLGKQGRAKGFLEPLARVLEAEGVDLETGVLRQP